MVSMTGAGFKVLVIEKDRQLAESTRSLLERESYDAFVSYDAENGLEQARALDVDMVLMDVALPGIGGVEACRRLRTFSDAYVIMLTGRDTETDRLIGLSVGADDYVSKPFSRRELLARIQAMRRRPRVNAVSTPLRRFGELEIDPGAREVTVAGVAVELTRTEYEILDALSAQPRLTLSRRQLLERIWGPSWFGDDHVIDVHVSNLRRKLENRAYVITVRGFGYRMGTG
jgi:DNA-binding response OmpR family regulator